jgi:rhodanese-related sulfurtransferase
VDRRPTRHRRAGDLRRPGPGPRNLERSASRIDGAWHIPLHELLVRADEIPAGELWVHCAAGYRASIAASILLARGHRVVAVDDDYSNAAATGLPVIVGA